MRTRGIAAAVGLVAVGTVAGSTLWPTGPVGAQVDPEPPGWEVQTSFGVLAFDRCLGFGSTTDLEEYLEAGEQGPIFGRRLGRTDMPGIVCERPASEGLDLWEWRAAVERGQPTAFRDAVFQRAAFGEQPALAFHVTNAIPIELVAIEEADGSVTEVVTFSGDDVGRMP